MELLKKIRMKILLRILYRSVKVGTNVYIAKGTHFRKNAVCIGDNVSIGRFCQFGARDTRIGNYVMISSYVGFLDRNAHEYDQVGTPFIETEPKKVLPIIVKDDVWIGFGAIICSGVTIGEGSVVAAGSLVVQDAPPFSIVASPKANVLSQRFDQETINIHKMKMREKYHIFQDS